jgi:hypothetical protein
MARMWKQLWPIITAGAIMVFLFGVILGTFAFNLMGSSPGEIAAALGCVIGGGIGAAAAVLAVQLTISKQREEDAFNVTNAVVLEVTTFAKYVQGALEICIGVAVGQLAVPTRHGTYIVDKLPTAIIFPAVADRIGLLPNPEATIEFYGRLDEARAMSDIIRKAADMNTSANIDGTVELGIVDIAPIADSLITALQLAKLIIEGASKVREPNEFQAQVRSIVNSNINDCLASARKAFPYAQSFADDPTPSEAKK